MRRRQRRWSKYKLIFCTNSFSSITKYSTTTIHSTITFIVYMDLIYYISQLDLESTPIFKSAWLGELLDDYELRILETFWTTSSIWCIFDNIIAMHSATARTFHFSLVQNYLLLLWLLVHYSTPEIRLCVCVCVSVCQFAMTILLANLLFYLRTENYVNWPDNYSTVPVPISFSLFFGVGVHHFSVKCVVMLIFLVSLDSSLYLSTFFVPIPNRLGNVQEHFHRIQITF